MAPNVEDCVDKKIHTMPLRSIKEELVYTKVECALGRAEEARFLAVVLGGHGNHADTANDAAHLQERTAGHAPQLLLELILRVASETVLDVHDRRAPLLVPGWTRSKQEQLLLNVTRWFQRVRS